MEAHMDGLLRGTYGGLLIAAAASLCMLLLGRITGISGILHSAVTGRPSHAWWRVWYLLGLFASGWLARAFTHVRSHAHQAEPTLSPPASVLILGGFLVGFGSRMSGGCTSGHGVCGLPRLSVRSLTAVLTFMTAAIVTRTLGHALDIGSLEMKQGSDNAGWGLTPTLAVLLVCMLVFSHTHTHTLALDALRTAARLAASWIGASKPLSPRSSPPPAPFSSYTAWECMTALSLGLLFGAGLLVAGMTDAGKVAAFLDIGAWLIGAPGVSWDPSLLAVMGSAVCVNVCVFALMRYRFPAARPLLHAYFTSTTDGAMCAADEHSSRHASVAVDSSLKPFWELLPFGAVPQNMRINAALLLGSALFGVGWGITGVCPGPAIVNVGGGVATASVVLPGILVGMAVYEAAAHGSAWLR